MKIEYEKPEVIELPSLVERLNGEIIRVKTEITPVYEGIGRPGKPAIIMMNASLDRAQKALDEFNVVSMLVAYKDLKGYEL